MNPKSSPFANGRAWTALAAGLALAGVLCVAALIQRASAGPEAAVAAWSLGAVGQLAAAAPGDGAAGGGDTGWAVRALAAAASLPGVSEAAFVDASGRTIASSRNDDAPPTAWSAGSLGRDPALFAPGSFEAGPDAWLAAAPVAGGGHAVLRIDAASVAAPAGALTFGGLAVMAMALAALFGTRAHASVVSHVVDAVESAFRRLAEGDTTVRLEESALGASARLGTAVNALAGGLGEVVVRVRELTRRVQGAPERTASAMDEISTGSEAQTEAVEETASLLANINTSIRGINTEVESLSRAAEEASSSVLQMGSSIEEVARSAGTLHESVDASTSSIHEMGASIRQVAESADAVQRMAEETASSMTEMDRTLQEVGDHVREASVLTERVSSGAEDGSAAVAATIEGIEEIRSLTRGAKDVLERLAARIHEIGQIVTVIGGINDETNLLSLNAAIIAAQAGEQGKAFAVVANHVKTLAQRTASSTQEIERLIGAVQAESENAMRAMAAGIDSVEAGVTRSSRAGEALSAIRESAKDASSRVTEIARAAAEQAQSSRHVAEAAQRTSAMVQQISSAISEQSRASDQMLKASEHALETCRQVHRSTSEQKETAKFITSSITSIGELIRSIHENTASHARASEAVSEAVMRILDNARKSSARIPEVTSTTEALRIDAEAMTEEMRRFRA
jgi:methyl-accepting chemotaxis protein